ncbi:unnamed protein product, partial [marine sediment metagenome]
RPEFALCRILTINPVEEGKFGDCQIEKAS